MIRVFPGAAPIFVRCIVRGCFYPTSRACAFCGRFKPSTFTLYGRSPLTVEPFEPCEFDDYLRGAEKKAVTVRGYWDPDPGDEPR